MGRSARKLAAALPLLLLAACGRSGPPTTKAASPSPPGEERTKREIRITGLIQAVHSVKLTVPQIQGQYSMMTLTQLVASGSKVKEGDLIATFDPTQQMDAARDAQAKFEDLGHQAEQKIAENRAAAEKRTVDFRQAEATLEKAKLELKKGTTLAEIDRLQNEAKAKGAQFQVESLKKSMAARDKSEAAGLRILELQRDRQKINLERAQANIQKLEIHAPLAGMVVHELTYRAGNLGHAQVGDQIYRGYPLVSIFDPSEMQVRCTINEPDVVSLMSAGSASVYLDAYPDFEIPASFVYASPIASSGLGNPIKSFIAVFRIDKPDPHLLPDLSAAVVVRSARQTAAAGGEK